MIKSSRWPLEWQSWWKSVHILKLHCNHHDHYNFHRYSQRQFVHAENCLWYMPVQMSTKNWQQNADHRIPFDSNIAGEQYPFLNFKKKREKKINKKGIYVWNHYKHALKTFLIHFHQQLFYHQIFFHWVYNWWWEYLSHVLIKAEINIQSTSRKCWFPVVILVHYSLINSINPCYRLQKNPP